MITCVIVDDEPAAIDILVNYARKIPDVDLVKTFIDPMEALSFLQKEPVDVVFLDIQMPEITGMQLVKIIAGRNRCKVVLTTAYTEYALEGYEHDIIDYLLKPVSFERFLKAVHKAESSLDVARASTLKAEQADDFILVKTEAKGKMIKIRFDSINYVEGLKNYVSIYIHSGERIVALLNIKDLEERLPANKFVRVQKSYIVALDKITGIDGNQVVLSNNEDRKLLIPLGKTYRKPFFDRIKRNILDRGK